MKKIVIILLCALATLNLRATGNSPDQVALITIKLENQDDLLPVIVEFYDAEAPRTVENFKKLARKGFYNGIAFHRVFPHTLVQAGDPLSKGRDRSLVGTGGPGYTLPPEINRKHAVGAVAMSRLSDKINPGRVSSGSQFYVCLKAQPNLDGQYTVFGHVTRGMDYLDKVSQLPVDSNDNPINAARIKSVRIMPLARAQIQAEREEKAKPSKLLQFFRSVSI
jgi:cyclophilin family peptidyl-prolyl cis-trans isomerase